MTFYLRISTMFVAIILFSISCKNEQKNVSAVEDQSQYELEDYDKLLKNEPTTNNLNLAMIKLGSLIADSSFVNQKAQLLLKGIEWSRSFENAEFEQMYALEYVKYFPKDEKSNELLWRLAEKMTYDKKDMHASLLYNGYISAWPNDSKASVAQERSTISESEYDEMFKRESADVFGTGKNFEINTEKVSHILSLTESLVISTPKHPKAVSYLMKAGEIAKAAQKPGKAIAFYDWIIDLYPENPDTGLALFLKAFTLENDLKKKEEAKAIYTKFLDKFPNHERSADVKFLLANIDKTDEEIIQTLNKK